MKLLLLQLNTQSISLFRSRQGTILFHPKTRGNVRYMIVRGRL